MAPKKIAIIGGGGRVATTAAAQFARFPECSQVELALYDVNAKAVEESIEIVMTGARLEGTNLAIHPATRPQALDGADMILYGALAPPCHTPPFNLEQTLGNIDQLLEVVEEAKRLCVHDFKIINFANPTDVLGMTVKARYPDLDIISHCTGPEELKRNMMILFDVPQEEEDRLTLRHVGGNHFGFVLKLELDGENLLPRLRTMKFDWRKFNGVRKGDGYDLARAISLFRASGIFTCPAGHIGFYHGIGANPGHSPDHGHWRPKKTQMVELTTSADVTPDTFWNLMDTWCTRSVAITALSFLDLIEDKPFAAQMPNDGFIHGLDDQAFVEAWGLVKSNGMFERFPLEFSPFINHLVLHNNWADYLMAHAIANQNYEDLCQAMMLRGDRSNFAYSIPTLRMYVSDKWGMEEDLDTIYTRELFEKEPDMEFPLMEFEDPIIGNFP